MKTPMFTRVCAILAIGAGVLFAAKEAMGDVMWTYDSSAKRITSIPPEGAGEDYVNSVYGLSDDGKLTKVTFGSDTVLDFRADALPSDAPAVKVVDKMQNNTVAEELYLPSTLTALNGATFYQWKALKHVEFPETVAADFRIWGQTFDGTAITNAILPEGMVKLDNKAFYGCSKLEYVKMPSTLKHVGEQVFDSDYALKLVEPCLPKGVTNFPFRVLQKCSMTNGVEIGFATDENGKPYQLTTGQYSLWGTKQIAYAKFGPGVMGLHTDTFHQGGYTKLGYLEFGENLKEIGLAAIGAANLSNIVFKATDTITFTKASFSGSSNIKEITWNGWFEYSLGACPFTWGSLGCRFIYPGDNLEWATYVADSTKVTPWKECSDADTNKYYEVYGKDAKEPVGISIAVSSGLARTYLVSNGKELAGAVISVTKPAAEFGTLTVSPEPDESGYYEADKVVTLTFEPAEGVTFRGWTGSVSSEEKTIQVTASGVKTVTPNYLSSFLYYDEEAGTLSDGNWTVAASGELGAITFGSTKVTGDDKHLNMGKPVKGKNGVEGKIIGIAAGAFDMKCKEAKVITLPDTLTTIGARAIVFSDRTQVSPLVPKGVTYMGYGVFLWEYYITGDVEIGYATDEDGNSVETVIDPANGEGSQFAKCYKIGPNIKLGPGIHTLPKWIFSEAGSNYGGAMEVWIGANVTKANEGAFNSVHGKKQVTYHFEGDMFDGSSKMFYSGTTLGAGDYMHRYFVGADGCKKWIEYISNTDYVTPWNQLDEATQETYWTNFPKETFGKKKPYGLTTANSVIDDTQGLPPNEWVFSLRQAGMVIRVQ